MPTERVREVQHDDAAWAVMQAATYTQTTIQALLPGFQDIQLVLAHLVLHLFNVLKVFFATTPIGVAQVRKSCIDCLQEFSLKCQQWLNWVSRPAVLSML